MERSRDSDLQRLMERLADGDRGAFHPVFEYLWPILRRFAAKHMPRHEAEDAAQEGLLKIFHRAADFDPSRSALAWALGITYHEVRTARRRRQRRREEALAPPGTAPGPAAAPSDAAAPTRADVFESPEEAAMRSEAEAILREALGALRPEDAETLRLYARGERATIAAATFRKRVERALGRLRAVWRTSRGPS